MKDKNKVTTNKKRERLGGIGRRKEGQVKGERVRDKGAGQGKGEISIVRARSMDKVKEKGTRVNDKMKDKGQDEGQGTRGRSRDRMKCKGDGQVLRER